MARFVNIVTPLKRRTVQLAAAALLLACWPFSAAAVASAQVPAEGAPNIVLIVLDDVGYSDLGAYGGEIRTPHIDRLAQAGTRFSRFYVASSCGPTRAMLMTGVDHHKAGVGSMPELMPLSQRGKPGYLGVLNDRVDTISRRLQDAGYFTAVAGKWHLGVDALNLPSSRGFDYSFIQADNGSDNFELRPYMPTQAAARWYENGERVRSLPETFYSSRDFVDRLLNVLAAPLDQGRPVFAYLAFQANHNPIQAPASFIDAYRGEYLDGWARVRQARLDRLQQLGLLSTDATVASGPGETQWQALSPDQQYFEARRMQAYAGMASAMDHEVGRLVTFLDERGTARDTVFILLSDNGAAAAEPYDNRFMRSWLHSNYHRDVETLGTRGSWVSAGIAWGRVSNTPFDGVKFSASEGGMRAPLVIAGVPGAPAGQVQAARAHVTDLYPTILALAGLPKVASGRAVLAPTGANLLPLLRGEQSRVHAPSAAVGYEFSGNSAVHRGLYKLTLNRPPAGDGRWRLYDLSTDPGETRDLATREPALYKEMLDAYAAYVQETGVLPMPENYSLTRQVAVNALLFSYLPRYGGWIVLVVCALVLLLWGWRRRAGGGR